MLRKKHICAIAQWEPCNARDWNAGAMSRRPTRRAAAQYPAAHSYAARALCGSIMEMHLDFPTNPSAVPNASSARDDRVKLVQPHEFTVRSLVISNPHAVAIDEKCACIACSNTDSKVVLKIQDAGGLRPQAAKNEMQPNGAHRGWYDGSELLMPMQLLHASQIVHGRTIGVCHGCTSDCVTRLVMIL